MNDDKRYVRNPDVIMREEDAEGGLLYNPDTNQIRMLNHTALFLWKRCEGVFVLEELLTALKEAYTEVPEAEAKEHVRSFMEDMIANGFIGTSETEG